MWAEKYNKCEKYIDTSIVIVLVLFSALYLVYSVFYANELYDLINFNTFAYVSKRVLFNPDSMFSLNKDIANVVYCESMPLCYPPGIYFITRIVSLLKDNQLTMHIFVLLLQIITVIFEYISLRKVSNRITSISFTIFLIFYTASITVVVDIFVQPLLAMCMFFLLTLKDTNKNKNLLILGVLAGAIFFIRQNVGLFLTNVIITWLLISSIFFNAEEINKKRWFLWIIAVIYSILGFVIIKTINNIDDKIWYGLCFITFWLMFSGWLYHRKDIGINLSAFTKRIRLFLMPLILIFSYWFYAFGSVVGIKDYLYIQFLMPFEFIKVFEHPIGFHLNLAYSEFIKGMMSGTIKSVCHSFISLMNWGALFLIPFVFGCFSVSYICIKIIRKKDFDIPDLRMASLPAVGILMFYPIESLWIVSTKLIVFLIPFAYFLSKLWNNNQKVLYRISLLFLIVSFPFLVVKITKNTYSYYFGQYPSYVSLSNGCDVKLPPDKAQEVKKVVNLIQSTVGHSKFYIFDSFTDLEMHYNLVDYTHKNYYIFLRRDTINCEAIKHILKMLEDYPHILINQMDYSLYTSGDKLYLSGGKYGRSIPNELMEYVTKNYEIIARYDKPEDLNDNFLSNFYILKKVNNWEIYYNKQNSIH
ncbi:MAG: glycosyltransferase family 39 protein [Thermodesulfobacteriota bacterium]